MMIRMTMMTAMWLLIIISWVPEVKSIRFEVASGGKKCILEDIKTNAMTIGRFSVVNPNPGSPMPDHHKVTVRVTSSKGSTYHTTNQVESGTFAFTAYEGGDYKACFWVNHRRPAIVLTIELDWKSGVAAGDGQVHKLATKGQVEAMESELNNMYDLVIMIHDEIFNLREREEEMQALNRSTNSNMAVFSFLSLLVCLSVAGLQLWHLKTFFERKKLL
ncbi:OLC1v1009621C1 [Oldenlandia corymbosa var. corymbosa]|uniref:OLC1v1009621C1 n=1 Tax=Oldenlandia corymbosa var. corymbosa TaxID=529605 RepID=A0AAV1DPX3_OLDCO|nr:OLC1v1009621C1 [Oldenlandia corymbosa var. corymbosa]